MNRIVDAGIHTVTITQDLHEEFHLSANPLPGESWDALFARVAEALRDAGAQVVSQEVFGVPSPEALAALEAMSPVSTRVERVSGGAPLLDWPVTWIEEEREDGVAVAGTQVWAVAGTPVSTVSIDGHPVGRAFESGSVRYCRLGGLAPVDNAVEPGAQARSVFERMDAGLAAADMTFNDTVRTWFYNKRILAWYAGFNEVRDVFFGKHRIFEGLVPASTGVGGANAARASLMAGLVAVPRAGGLVKAFPVASPLQCPAIDYGSSFSRAVEVDSPGLRRLYISGTASIAPEGHSVHVGDIDAQIALTMDVVHAILESRSMDWPDTSRAILYFKRPEDAPAFERYRAAQGIDPFPAVAVINDICRDDLLFEIELDAIAAE